MCPAVLFVHLKQCNPVQPVRRSNCDIFPRGYHSISFHLDYSWLDWRWTRIEKLHFSSSSRLYNKWSLVKPRVVKFVLTGRQCRSPSRCRPRPGLQEDCCWSEEGTTGNLALSPEGGFVRQSLEPHHNEALRETKYKIVQSWRTKLVPSSVCQSVTTWLLHSFFTHFSFLLWAMTDWELYMYTHNVLSIKKENHRHRAVRFTNTSTSILF